MSSPNNLVVAQSGGPSPVINNTVRGVVEAARQMSEIGTIYGAVLGALIMQSLQSGMAMVGVDAPFQNIVVGAVLVLAVLVDIVYRKRTGDA